ncbi:MAG: hypothetical protein LBS53_15970 [Synergistaceae bacterium]|nr:hypothetical protein [Synergistaceae bacterium]
MQTLSIGGVADGETVEVIFSVDGGGLLHVEVRRGKKKTSRRTISLESDEHGESQCDLPAEIRIRENRLARLSMAIPGDFQPRIAAITKDARVFRGEDRSLQWKVLEVLDRMIAEMEQVISP